MDALASKAQRDKGYGDTEGSNNIVNSDEEMTLSQYQKEAKIDSIKQAQVPDCVSSGDKGK